MTEMFYTKPYEEPLTNGKELNTSILQALGRNVNSILGFPIGDQDPDFRHVVSRTRFWFEAVLQKVCEGQTCGHTMFKSNQTSRIRILFILLRVRSPVSVFPPLYGRFLTASMTDSLVVKALRCHSILGSPLY